jgi:hypothetical protein
VLIYLHDEAFQASDAQVERANDHRPPTPSPVCVIFDWASRRFLSSDVRFVPKAIEVPPCSEMTRWAICRHAARRQRLVGPNRSRCHL